MKKNKLFFVFLLLSCCVNSTISTAQDADYEWAKSIGGTGADVGRGVTVDSKGDVYMTGSIGNNGINFNVGGSGGVMLSAGSIDAFLAKYNEEGTFLWAKSMGGTGRDIAQAVAVDGNDNVYITGQLPAVGADFNIGGTGGFLLSAGGDDVFIAKYSPEGNFLWAKSMGGKQEDIGWAVDVDNNGNVYVTGSFAREADFNPGGSGGMLYGTGRTSIFVAKYDSSGNFLWAKSMGGSGDDRGNGVVVDGSDNVYITGYFMGDGDFNEGGSGGVITAAGSLDVFIAKYDSSGTFVWVKALGGTGGDWGQKIAIDSSNNLYVTGAFTTAADFNPGGSGGILSSAGGEDVFLAKYDSSGAFFWAKAMGGTSLDGSFGVATDEIGNVYIAGRFGYGASAGDFNPGGTGGLLDSKGECNVFIVKHDRNGVFLWAKRMGGGRNTGDYGYGIAQHGNGNVYVTGELQSSNADFAPDNFQKELKHMGGSDVFLLKISCPADTGSLLELQVCDELDINGRKLTETGLYYIPFTSTYGCDSIVPVNLYIEHLKPIISVNERTLQTTEPFNTYQWIKDGKDIPGATNSTLNITENGNYQVRATNKEGCEGTSEVYIVNNATGIEQPQAQKIRVFPNPSDDIIFVESAVFVKVSAVTIEGRELSTSDYAVSHKISVKDWASGVYYINLINQEGKLLKVEKIIKP